ncbi:uncharacterized protein LOC114541922 [Dendronephthya gigantea]|uniref:uncharacterized protein LOC114541922 n=1 Tax=Dendronephthya gigantea TaxID=151771 RepID=UPI00106D167E|nr:uncharacterized protein LOC114541922 [Dendronephthya gigantea]
MASKGTPKKYYKNPSKSSVNISRCRLCNSVGDPRHCKGLFRDSNVAILRDVETIFGDKLPQSSNLPHLICRPCERRLKTAILLKKTIYETQQQLQEEIRAKRCVEISPSVDKPAPKVRATGITRRRSIDFDIATSESASPTTLPSQEGELLDLAKANQELIEVARRSEPSVLRQISYDGMSDEGWMSEVLEEMATRCPVVNKILLSLIESSIYPGKKNPGICLIYGIIMFLRCHELSRIQRINSVLLVQGQASVNCIAKLNKYGLCLEPTKKYKILDDVGKHLLDRATELVKSGYKFVYVLDNIDWEEKAHDMRQDIQNRSVHAVASSIVFNRVPDQGFSDSGPQQDLRKINARDVVAVNDSELKEIRSRYQVIIAKILFEHLPSFAMFQPFTPQTTKCVYSKELSEKSEVVTMPVLMKDEKKYSDCVDVLDQLEKWTREIYSSAGLCAPEPEENCESTPAIGTTSRPDQPASHVPPAASESDPLHGVKVPCFGDQLTRVRFAGAKDLRAGCHSAKQRLDHLYPFCIVDWHTKRSYLKTVFKKLYLNSGREKGTLRFFREKLNRRNVTADVKHYEDCEQLFFSVGKCFVIEALLEFFQMGDAKHKPTANGPHSVYVLSEEYQKSYLNNTLDKFLNEYVFVGDDETVATDDETTLSGDDETTDGVWAYSINILKSFLLLADIKDAVATGNGEYLCVLRKQLLQHFFSTSGFNEFTIEMFINILQTKVLLSEAEAHRCKWAATVNWKGGNGKNIEIDLFQENRNCEMKKLIRSMGANKTEKAIERASKASGGVSKIVEAFEGQVNIRPKSSGHTHKSSADDEQLIGKDLRALRPFRKEEGRMFETFGNISCDPLHSFNEEKFKEWIDRHKNNILMHYPVFDDREQSTE